MLDAAVLVAMGVTESGHRRLLGVSVALAEAEVHCQAFLDSLIQRGLKFIASETQTGLQAARRAMFPDVAWQRTSVPLATQCTGLRQLPGPAHASCLRLISVLLADQDDEWMTAKIYLTMTS